MKKTLTACALAFTAVIAMAQTTTDTTGVTTSTDPAKAAAVERKAAELKNQDRNVATNNTAPVAHKARGHHSKRHQKSVAHK